VFGSSIGRLVSTLGGLAASRAVWEQIGVFSSNLALNASLFVVLFVASVLLDTHEFARLSLGNNVVVQFANVIGFGLDFAALILSIESKRGSFIAINLVMKAAVFVFAFLLLLVWTSLVQLRFELVIFAAAAGVAFWASAIAVTQYERQFTRFALMHAALAVSRLTFGVGATLLRSWVLIILAVHVLAQVPIHLVTFAAYMRKYILKILTVSIRPDFVKLLTFSPLIFTSGILSSVLPLITQSLLYSRTDSSSTSAFGVVLIFAAPLNTLAATLEVYLLPQVLSRRNSEIDVFGLGPGSIKFLAFGFGTVLLLASIPAAIVLDWIYGQRMPLVAQFFVTYFGALVLSYSIAFYNLQGRRSTLVRVMIAVNFCRAVATGLLGVLPGIRSIVIVSSSAVILVAGEVALWIALSRAEQCSEKE
jgi:hypothetical protein